MASVQIEQLVRYSEYVPTIAQWIYEEWWQSKVTGVQVIVDRLAEQNQIDRIPLTLVASAGDVAVGCASLLHNDMQSRPQLSPWLAAVFVRRQFRRQGIGALLVKAAMAKANELGASRLYLATPDRQEFYARLGWQPVERNVGPRRQTIMAISFVGEPLSCPSC